MFLLDNTSLERNWLFFAFKKVEMAFGPCAAYLVDAMHSRSAEGLAANKYVDPLSLISKSLNLNSELLLIFQRSEIYLNGFGNCLFPSNDRHFRNCGHSYFLRSDRLAFIWVSFETAEYTGGILILLLKQDFMLHYSIWHSDESFS